MKEGLQSFKRAVAGTLAAVTIGASTPAMAEGLSENPSSSPSISTTENTNGITTSEQGLASLLSENNLEMASLSSTESTIQMDVAAQVVNDRTLVPIRFVAESLGCNVDWNEEAQTATVTNKDTTIVLTKNKDGTLFSNKVIVNGVEKTVDVPARIINDRTMVPLRFLSENMGLAVSYDGYTQGVGLIDSKNSQALTLTINSKEVGIHSGLTSEEQLRYSQEYIDAKNVVVDNLNVALNTLKGRDAKSSNPFGLNTADVEQYKKTGIDDGLNSFQVLNYVAEDGNQLPGIVLVTNGEYGMSQYVEQMKQSIDWLNSVDPALVKSLLTTKYISGDIAPADTLWTAHPGYASTYYQDKGIFVINESGSVLKGFTEARKYIDLSYLFMVESKAIQLQQQNPSMKLLDVGVGKGQFVIDWANNLKNQNKISTDEWEILTKSANSTISYYRKNYS